MEAQTPHKDKDTSPQNRGGALDSQTKDLGSEDKLEEEIDRDSDESFPASDPPGWNMGTESGYGSKDTKPHTSTDIDEGSPSAPPAEKPES